MCFMLYQLLALNFPVNVSLLVYKHDQLSWKGFQVYVSIIKHEMKKKNFKELVTFDNSGPISIRYKMNIHEV